MQSPVAFEIFKTIHTQIGWLFGSFGVFL